MMETTAEMRPRDVPPLLVLLMARLGQLGAREAVGVGVVTGTTTWWLHGGRNSLSTERPASLQAAMVLHSTEAATLLRTGDRSWFPTFLEVSGEIDLLQRFIKRHLQPVSWLGVQGRSEERAR